VLRFGWHHVIATVSDDSVSYLTLAQWLSGDTSNAHLARWTWWHAHFPPLFPLLLAGTGAWRNLLAAHLLVAGLAAVALVPTYRYALLRLESVPAALSACALFVLAPAAWIHVVGILSESLFLLLTMAALRFHERRLRADTAREGEWLAFGLLVALACATRLVGVAMLLALAVQMVFRLAGAREGPRIRQFVIAFVPTVVVLGAWMALRPIEGADKYQGIVESSLSNWIHIPLTILPVAATSVLDAWVAAFAVDPNAPAAMRIVFIVLGAMALAGAALAARRNRLDGWYFLVYTAVIFGWVFGTEVTRRLLYPVIPLAIILAAVALREAARKLRVPARASLFLGGAIAAIPAVLCVPGLAQVQQKSFDTAQVLPGAAYANADITDYYTTRGPEARTIAAGQIATLAGLQSLERATPPAARVMWMRPEYVAFLGHREGVPWYFDWDARRLAQEVRATGTTHVVLSRYVKTDLTPRPGDPTPLLPSILEYSRTILTIPDATDGSDAFLLLQVEPARLAAFLGPA
jgi:4-amino-4-deoxy-L-arabinose transferase-like glycosyltransferase